MSLPRPILKILNEELDKVLLEQAQANADLKRKQMAAFLYYKEIVKNGFDFKRQKPEVKYSSYSEYELSKGKGSGKAKDFVEDKEFIGPDNTVVMSTQGVSLSKDGSNQLHSSYNSFNYGNETTKTMELMYDYLSPTWDTFGQASRENFQSVIELRFMPLIEKSNLKGFKSFNILDTHIIHSLSKMKTTSTTTNSREKFEEEANINTVITSIYRPQINGKTAPAPNLEKKLNSLHEKAIRKFMPLTPSQISSAEKMSNIA